MDPTKNLENGATLTKSGKAHNKRKKRHTESDDDI